MTIKFKTITYKRILNLGNYESKHLEATIEIPDYITAHGAEEECSILMEFVETKIREEQAKSIEQKITALEKDIEEIRATRDALRSLYPSDSKAHQEQVGEGGMF